MPAVPFNPFVTYTDSNGNPLAGGKIQTFIAGTNTPLASYTDASGLVAATNPIILDSAGRSPYGAIWGSGTYKFVLRDAADVLIQTNDNVTATFGTGDMVKTTYDPANISQQVVGTTAPQALTNKTVNGVTLSAVAGASVFLAGDGTYKAAGITLGNVQNSTSGTSIDFTSLPAGIKRLTVNFVSVSTSGTSVPIIQLGDSGGVETSGYLGGSSSFSSTIVTNNFTTGIAINSIISTSSLHGSVVFNLVDSATNTWAAMGIVYKSDSAIGQLTAGSKALSSVLDRVRITTVGGTDTFDAGQINISYE